MNKYSTLEVPSTTSTNQIDDETTKLDELLTQMGQTLPSSSKKVQPQSGINFTNEGARMLRALPNKKIGFSELSGGESRQFHGHEIGRVNFPMDGMGPTRSNPLSKNCDEYGGVPFYMHKGKQCHRGVKQFKVPSFHPSEIQKRIFYRDDGSGRDTYITANNGGLTVAHQINPHGTDPTV